MHMVATEDKLVAMGHMATVAQTFIVAEVALNATLKALGDPNGFKGQDGGRYQGTILNCHRPIAIE